MTPREKLVNDYSEKFGGNAGFEVLRDMENNMEQLLEPYAIGKWVPVEERLPEERKSVITRWSDESLSFITFIYDGDWSLRGIDNKVTHWLELDMPEAGA